MLSLSAEEAFSTLTASLVELAKTHELRAVLGRVGLAQPGHLEVRPLAAIVGHQLARLA